MITIPYLKPTITIQIAASASLGIEANFVLDLFSQSYSRIAEAQAAHLSAGKHFWRTRFYSFDLNDASAI